MSPKDRELYNFLKQYTTEERQKRFEEVLDYRTRHVTVVLEDIYQSHNASAVLRSCDINGIQDIHVIENRWVYNVNPDIVVGSIKWLDLKKYNEQDFNTPEAFDNLHKKGYKIVATCPHQNDFTPEELPLDEPVAIVFGTEKTGLSQYALENADMYVKIPMYGFTESLNVSVCGAIIMYSVMQRLRVSDIDWHLSDKRKTEVLFQWYKNAIKASDEILERFNGGK
jgi:tRNA (guanosine-2'-O-)-methyltransferase